MKLLNPFAPIQALAIAALLACTCAQAAAAREPDRSASPERVRRDQLVAALSVVPADLLRAESAGPMTVSDSTLQLDDAAGPAQDGWALLAGGIGLFVFVVKRRLGD